MSKALSPAAEAVWEAFNEVADRVGVFEDYGDALAAALRAVADQVVPIERPVGGGFRQHRSATAERLENRRRILAIATELEGTSPRPA
jgi:hypothetical protein